MTMYHQKENLTVSPECPQTLHWDIGELSFAEYGLFILIATCSGGIRLERIMSFSNEPQSDVEEILHGLIDKKYIQIEGGAE